MEKKSQITFFYLQEKLKKGDYYFSLNNTNYCYQVAKYLEYRMFENEFPGFN